MKPKTHRHPKVRHNPELLFHKPDVENVDPDDLIPIKRAAQQLGIGVAELEDLVDRDFLDTDGDEAGSEGVTGESWIRFARALKPAGEAARHHAGSGDLALYEVACPKCRRRN